MTIPEQPFAIPSAWRGDDLREHDDWCERWTDAEIAELDRALAAGPADRLPSEAAEFPLSTLITRIDGWMREIDAGRGFVLVRGLPVDRYTTAECERIYYGLGLYMGRATPQNTDGDLLGHVRDTGEDPAARGVRLYRTRAEQDFHTDGADVIGLMCLKGARSGGISRIVSSVTIFNEILGRAPELVPTLFEPFPFDRQGQEKAGERGWFEFPICRTSNAGLGTFFIPWYIRESQQLADAPRLTAAQTACLELIETIANEPDLYLDMTFEAGDIQLLKNAVILHKRTAYEDWPEPAEKRHLLRLWLSGERFTGGSALLGKGIS
ncbi:MAG TPA: TauD/TfdA family dioxygenase [Pseudomonadales bacterium]|nr:TauD/TfdA family dioxygenase [Pseudomonadales bacterium]